MRKQKGSLTVEAALIVPLVLTVFALAVNAGISLYTECREMAAEAMVKEDIDAAELFYAKERVKDIAKYGDSLH
ncbi:MAG: hypothetical protein HDQ95_09400 [Roseburia sp.]|nr:hypothetical protein [Roseburia sp.]